MAYRLFSQTNNTGTSQSAADSSLREIRLQPLLHKKQQVILSSFLLLEAKAIPTASGK
jgi:hypothetical protein